jgi:molybdopterin molybdotransferase
MLSVEQALEKILPAFRLLPAEVIPLENALGRVLAEDVRAENDMPPFANSSMDGYAIRAADIAPSERNAPIRLTVIGDIPAGIAPTFVVGQGEAARIMTGAMMPYGADTVVPVENTDDPGFRTGNTQLPAHITIQRISDTGAYVRLPGEDVRRGDVVLRSGRVLRVADLGVLAGLGVPRVSVIGRPVVAILSTGDELLTASDPLQPGKIRDSNSYTVAAMVESLGSTPLRLGIARDTVEDVATGDRLRCRSDHQYGGRVRRRVRCGENGN